MEEESAEYKAISEESKDQCKLIDEHYLRKMLLTWLSLPIGGLIAMVSGFFLSSTGVIGSSNSKPLSIDLQPLQSLNSDIFIATLTVAGFIIGIVPLLSFFVLGEMKDVFDSQRKTIETRRKGRFPEIKQLLDQQECYLIINQANVKKAIKSYTKIAVVFSMSALVALIFGYLSLGLFSTASGDSYTFAGNIAVNLMLSFTILLFIVMEIVPLARVAFVQPGFKILRLFDNKGREIALIMTDDKEPQILGVNAS